MTSWLSPWWWLPNGLLSGNTNKDIATITSLFSPQFDIDFAGNQRIEAKVVKDVASYGKQLGILSEAVLELAGHHDKGEAVVRLEKLMAEIDEAKRQDAHALEQQVKEQLEQLKGQDPKAFERVVGKYRSKEAKGNVGL